MEILYEDTFLEISCRIRPGRKDSNIIILSFSGVGIETAETSVQSPEFYGLGRAYETLIFVKDKTRSWGARLDFGIIHRTIQPLIADKVVYVIGNSMGGYLAIMSSHFLPVQKVLAFVPQFSIEVADVPWEERWVSFRQNIPVGLTKPVTEYINSETEYHVLFGKEGLDTLHAAMFPKMSNMNVYVFEMGGHGLARQLKQEHKLQDVIVACLHGDPSTVQQMASEKTQMTQ